MEWGSPLAFGEAGNQSGSWSAGEAPVSVSLTTGTSLKQAPRWRGLGSPLLKKPDWCWGDCVTGRCTVSPSATASFTVVTHKSYCAFTSVLLMLTRFCLSSSRASSVMPMAERSKSWSVMFLRRAGMKNLQKTTLAPKGTPARYLLSSLLASELGLKTPDATATKTPDAFVSVLLEKERPAAPKGFVATRRFSVTFFDARVLNIHLAKLSLRRGTNKTVSASFLRWLVVASYSKVVRSSIVALPAIVLLPMLAEKSSDKFWVTRRRFFSRLESSSNRSLRSKRPSLLSSLPSTSTSSSTGSTCRKRACVAAPLKALSPTSRTLRLGSMPSFTCCPSKRQNRSASRFLGRAREYRPRKAPVSSI